MFSVACFSSKSKLHEVGLVCRRHEDEMLRSYFNEEEWSIWKREGSSSFVRTVARRYFTMSTRTRDEIGNRVKEGRKVGGQLQRAAASPDSGAESIIQSSYHLPAYVPFNFDLNHKINPSFNKVQTW